MTPPSSTIDGRRKNACAICARRKIKCDKAEPYSNCVKAKAQCCYGTLAPPRPRKRAAEDDLVDRLNAYEDLMRKNNVDFTALANAWIPSGLEAPLKESGSPSPSRDTGASCPLSIPGTSPPTNTPTTGDRCLWSKLSPELKHPPIQSLRHRDDPSLHPMPQLEAIFANTGPPLHGLHPEPRTLFRLWQIFVDSVNPLTKIIHVPTLQQRIMEANWDPSSIPKPLSATLFAIYTLAVTSMSSDDCQASFNETRATLLTRYRAATLHALVAADFLATRDFEVLQAFVLFLFANPESELASTLTGAAKRLGQKMGLHSNKTEPWVSFFEKEMRIRLWWQLLGLDSRTMAIFAPGMRPPLPDLEGLRLPLNVNDADLHPDMTEPPTEHKTPNEMMCVLMKLEVSNWLRSTATGAKVFENISQSSLKGTTSTRLKDEVINELEAIYKEKYFRNCDKEIPLHGLTQAMAKLAIARMRFGVHHPRGRAAINGGDVYLTSEENDILFESALTIMEMINFGTKSRFSSHIFTHLATVCQMDACIYVISELRRRPSGGRVELAWKLIRNLYTDHLELIDDAENSFFSALGGLILEAWETRRTELVGNKSRAESQPTPDFIQSLCDKRMATDKENASAHLILPPEHLDDLGTNDGYIDWEYWNGFLRL